MPVKTEQQQPWENCSNEYQKMEWEGDLLDLTFLDLPTSEFITSAEECELYSSGTFCFEPPTSPKNQIRHHDCMWSGICVDETHPGKIELIKPEPTPTPPPTTTTITTTTAPINPQNTTAANIFNKPASTLTATQLNSALPLKLTTAKAQQIPAGRSLLINPRMKQNQINKVPTLSTTDFLKEREHAVIIARPDTPLSLDDDPPEFKHNIDLATCTIGSNKMSLVSQEDASSTRIINMLKEHLEDTSNDTSLTNKNISADIRSYMSNAGSLSDLLKDLKYLSDYEEIEEDDDSQPEADSDAESSSSGSSSSKGGGSMSHPQKPTISYEYQGTHVGDHSYTRPKTRYPNPNELGVQTPSDSEEEIDVVSIGDKNLPTNPTARDRRALQTTVAHKIRKGARTHPQRRRCSDDDFISTPSSTTTPTKSSVSNHYAFSPNYATPSSSSSISGENTPLPLTTPNSTSRKRQNKGDSDRSSHSHSNSKRNRGKKQRPAPGKKVVSEADSEEADTLEKRNLHNDMERQRRIGLKNLFEELKRQIPSIRDKERAPKVNILREAASLCNRLNREQEQLNALRKQQQRLYNRVRQLRSSLHSQRRLGD